MPDRASRRGRDTIAEMKGKPIMISLAGRAGFCPYLKAKHGFGEEQIRPYNVSLAPFLADPKAVVQGFVTSEAWEVERITHPTRWRRRSG